MRPPRWRLAPRDRNHQVAPPRPSGGGARGPGGDCGEPPLPATPPPPLSPPSPAHGRPEAGRRGSGPAPPERAAAPRGGPPQPRRAQPRAKRPQSAAHSLPQCPLPTGSSAPVPWATRARQHPGMCRQSSPPWCLPGEGGGTDCGKRTSLPPSRQADQPAADQAAPGAQGCLATPAERLYAGEVRQGRRGTERGARGPAPDSRGVRNRDAAPLPSPPDSL